MAEFVKTKAGDKEVYTNKTTGRQVKAEDLAPALKEELDLADLGTIVDDSTITKSDGDGVTDKDGKPLTPVETPEEEDEKPAPTPEPKRQTRAKRAERVNPYRRDVPQTEKGFGFPRKNGKTVDIFDGETPHTQVRVVEGLMVPLNDENYRSKTDAEIYDRLVELELV